jgi:nucleoside-diphosphate-sugar epimerase
MGAFMSDGAGFIGRRTVRAPLEAGAEVTSADISVARGLGYQPEHDLKAGIATVWPEFSETYQ